MIFFALQLSYQKNYTSIVQNVQMNTKTLPILAKQCQSAIMKVSHQKWFTKNIADFWGYTRSASFMMRVQNEKY